MIGLRNIRFGPRIGSNVGLIGDTSSTTLTVAIADSVDPVISVVNFTYSVVVTNTGSVNATSVSAVITLDPSLTFVSAVGTGWSTGAVGQVVTCTRATLAPGAAPTITITVTTANAASTETTTADASALNAPAATQDSETTVVKLVDRDATNGIRYPSSATQYSDFRVYHLAIGTPNFPDVSPSFGFQCQEASGNLTSFLDALTLTANGTPLYSQAVTGATRVGVGFNGGVNQRFTAGVGVGPNPNTTSLLELWDWEINATPGVQVVATNISDGATNFRTMISTTPRWQCAIVGVTTTGTADPTASDNQPTGMLYDRTNSRAVIYNGAEKVTGTFNATVVDGRKGIGGATAPTGVVSYGLWFVGAAAELTDLQIKAIQVARGWSIPWS